MEDRYEDLRNCIYTNQVELERFRQLVVNSVMATDIVDKELGALRKGRWLKAFSSEDVSDAGGDAAETEKDQIDRKATIVIEHIVQAADVSHMMQRKLTRFLCVQFVFVSSIHFLYESLMGNVFPKPPSPHFYTSDWNIYKKWVSTMNKSHEINGVSLLLYICMLREKCTSTYTSLDCPLLFPSIHRPSPKQFAVQNEKFFRECYKAYLQGRAEKNPVDSWYQGEIGFFDFYVLPLAKKLKDCGVFGVSSDEFLNYAKSNRKEWEAKGKHVVDEYVERYNKENS